MKIILEQLLARSVFFVLQTANISYSLRIWKCHDNYCWHCLCLQQLWHEINDTIKKELISLGLSLHFLNHKNWTRFATWTFQSASFKVCKPHDIEHTHTHPFNGPFSGTTWVGRYQRGKKPIWILLKQETVSGSGIHWAICKSAPHSRQTTTPVPHDSVFYRPDALPAAQPTASKHWRQKIDTTLKLEKNWIHACTAFK